MGTRVEIDFDELVHETPQAYCINIDSVQHWLPKSQSEIVADGLIEVEEWLAIEEGLI